MQNKYQKYYDSIINYRKKQPVLNGYYEVHHIIPKSLGGLNNTDNLVTLTAREHLIVHKLLKKITFILFGIESKQYKSMIYALWQMSNRNNNSALYMSGKEYERLRLEFSQIQSKQYLGIGNPRYGKKVKQSTKDKISAANKGKTPWIKGKHHSDKTKKLMSKNHADISGNKNPMYGKKHKIESIQKMKDHQWDRSGSKNPMFGKKLSITEKQHLSQMLSGEKHPMYGKKRPLHSKKMTGKNNPAFGRKWMYNSVTKEKVYAKKEDIQKYLNLGFIFGTGKKINSHIMVNEKNRAESLCNSIERAFKDVPADKITEDEKKPVIDAIAKVREVIKTDDIDKIKSEVEAMNKLYEPLATKLYAANGQPQFTQEQMEQMMKDPKFKEAFGNAADMFGGTNTASSDDGTVDAKFE